MHSLESLRLLVQEFTAKSNRVLEYSKHQLATGLHRERIVESFIKKLTPNSLDVGSGFIYDNENSSPQIDIIVHNHNHFSPVFSEGGYLILLPDSVVQTIEVKSKFTSNSLETALENCYECLGFNKNINSSIFGFDGLKDPEKAFDVIESFVKNHQYEKDILEKLPTAIVSLNNWVILFINRGEKGEFIYPKKESFEEQFLYYFSSIYYKNYGYIRKLVDGNLPLLVDQGFPVEFHHDEVRYLRFGPKNA